MFSSAYFAPKEYLGSFLLRKPYLTAADVAFAHMRLGAALRPLAERCLVRDAPGMVITPFLAQAVLGDLLCDRLESVAEEASHLQASRGQLYGAGWTVGSVASRITCQSILRARIEDLRSNRIESFLATSSGSARWITLVAEAWGRNLQNEVLLLNFLATIGSNQSTKENLSFKALVPESYEAARAAVRRAPQLLREDIELSINVSRVFVESHRKSGFNVDEASPDELRARLSKSMESVGRMFERYKDSPDGQIEVSILLDWVSDGGDEKFQATMREMFPDMEGESG